MRASDTSGAVRKTCFFELGAARLAQVVRDHYTAHPEALQLQARGNVIPGTVANHRTVERVRFQRK